jgi:hypothetical protein
MPPRHGAQLRNSVKSNCSFALISNTVRTFQSAALLMSVVANLYFKMMILAENALGKRPIRRSRI